MSDAVAAPDAQETAKPVERAAPLQGGALALLTFSVAFATFMEVLDTTIVNVAIPTIAGDVGVSASQGTWVISSYGVSSAIAVPLMPGRSVDVREHRFLTASLNVTYDWYSPGVWYTTRSGDETETHYPVGMYVDRFSATDTPGLLMLHGRGNVFVRDLQPGQTICVHPGSFVWKDSSVALIMHLERPASGGWFSSWQPSTPWLRFTGPGRVAVSSAYERMESTGRIVNA